ncbi:MAG: AMP-binding protein [Candidatus Rifleibacteriota bacterium]
MFLDTLKIKPAEKYLQKDAIIFDNGNNKSEKLTFKELKDNIELVSETLLKAGVKKGNRVILLSENHSRWLPIFLGITGAGAVAVPVDGNLAIERFHDIVKDCQPAAIFVSRKFEARLEEFMLSECDVIETLHLHFDLILFNRKDNNNEKLSVDLKPEDTAAIIYTSGTTGRPKGIMLSHHAFKESIDLGTRLSKFSSTDSMLALLPFTHVFALVDSGLVQLNVYSTIVICNSFNPAEILQVLSKYKLNHILAVPRLAELFAMGLMHAPDLKLPGLKMIIGGASPRPEIMKLMMSREIKVLQGYGMTETAAGVLMCQDGPLESVGKPVPEVKVKINQPVGGIGELWISTPTIFSGVFQRPDLNSEMFEGEYFKTGDLASIDEDGYVYIRGRAKEVIISSSGLNVYPDELEKRLGTLPYAEEFSIFGYVSEGLEVPAIALLKRNEYFKDNSVGKVQEFVEEDLRKRTAEWPEAERLRKVFLCDSPLPRSASAKIKRFEVSAMFNPTNNKTKVKNKKADRSKENDEELFDLFRGEVAEYLNADIEQVKLDTRLDSFLQLDSLGIVALLANLEKKFEVSFVELMGTPVETFSELFDYLLEKTNVEKLLDEKEKIQESDQVTMPAMLDLSPQAIAKRHEFIGKKIKQSEFEMPVPDKPESYSGNIEGLVGITQLPTGVCGPLKINGDHAKGDFYIPLATTEGALVASVARGCQIITRSGGAEVTLVDDSIVRTPIFVLNSLKDQSHFAEWVDNNIAELKSSAESTTSHGKLLKIDKFQIGTKLVLRFVYFTGDASGQNMTTIATRKALDYILENYDGKIQDWFLESNLSGDKKINAINFTGNRGKKVVAVCRIPAKLVKKHLHTSPERMCRLGELSMITSLQAHSFGIQGHYANIMAAVYIATGQDPACVAESAVGITHLEMVGDKLEVSVTLPGIMVGTVGGGTRFETQKRCLQLMECAGAGKAKKMAEILACAVLAGEISITGAMAADEFTRAHARYGRKGGLKAGGK